MAKSLAALFWGGALCVSALAQAPAPAPSALPSADDVVKRYVKAIGGQDAWQKLTSRQVKGTLDIPAMNLSGTLESHEKAPNKMLHVSVLAGASYLRGFDGASGWADDPQNGLRDLAGAELEDMKREADFYRPLNLQKTYSKMTVTGTKKVSDRDAYVVEAALPQGDSDKLFFDVQSGLLVRTIQQEHTALGALTIQADLSDYRDVDGVKMPFSIRQSNPQFEFSLKFTEVHHNVRFDDTQFSKPAAQ